MTISNGNAEQLLNELTSKLDYKEPCAMPDSGKDYDIDKWVGAWTNSAAIATAEELCGDCHVLGLCREYAIVAEEPSYIWGGTTPQQRKEINAQRRRTKRKNTKSNQS